MLLAETAVAAELAETAVAAEMSTAMDIGLVRQAMAWRLKYRVAKKQYRCLDWLCTHRTAEGCTRSQTLFATWA